MSSAQRVRRGGAVCGALLVGPLVLGGCVSLDEPVYGDAGPPRWGPEEVPDLETMLRESEDVMAARDTFRADVVVDGDEDLQSWEEPWFGEASEVAFTVSGAEDAAQWWLSADDEEVVEARVVDGRNYMSPSSLVALLEAVLEEDPLIDSSDVDLGLVEEDLDGRWAEDVFEGSTFDWFSLEELLEAVEDELDGEDPAEIGGELRMTAEGYVYRYAGEGYDITFAAEQEPVLSRADYDEVRVELSGWDEQEVPEAPSEIVSDRELEEILVRALGGGFDDGFGDGGGRPGDDSPSVPARR